MKIFKPRRASRDKINSDSTIKLDNGELMVVKKERTNPNSSFDIYIGNSGLSSVKNMKPALYGDTAEEPMSYVEEPAVTTTSAALNHVTAGNTFAQTIGALKKAIELYRVEQDTWYTAPSKENLPTGVTGYDYFSSAFTNINNLSPTNPILVYRRAPGDISRDIYIRYDNDSIDGINSPLYGEYYLDLSNISTFSEIMIKATISTSEGGYHQIVLPIGSLPKDRIYPFLNPKYTILDPSQGGPFNPTQSYRNGYSQNLDINWNEQTYKFNGGEIGFYIYRERIYFNVGFLNNNRHEIGWAFCWKERN